MCGSNWQCQFGINSIKYIDRNIQKELMCNHTEEWHKMPDSISSRESILANGRKVIVKLDKTKTNRAHNKNKSEIKTTKPNRIVFFYHTKCMCVCSCVTDVWLTIIPSYRLLTNFMRFLRSEWQQKVKAKPKRSECNRIDDQMFTNYTIDLWTWASKWWCRYWTGGYTLIWAE